MAHDYTVLDLIGKTMKLKRNQKEKEDILSEFYSLTNEYNEFVKIMDKRLDRITSRIEAMVEDGC